MEFEDQLFGMETEELIELIAKTLEHIIYLTAETNQGVLNFTAQ